jgi:hypothetical protein
MIQPRRAMRAGAFGAHPRRGALPPENRGLPSRWSGPGEPASTPPTTATEGSATQYSDRLHACSPRVPAFPAFDAEERGNRSCVSVRMKRHRSVWRIPQSLPSMVRGRTGRGRSIGMTSCGFGSCGPHAGEAPGGTRQRPEPGLSAFPAAGSPAPARRDFRYATGSPRTSEKLSPGARCAPGLFGGAGGDPAGLRSLSATAA